MAPEPVTDPERRFVITRLEGDAETTLDEGALLEQGFSTDAPAREVAMLRARELREANPGWVILVYSPSNGGAHIDDDLCWDSRISG